MLVLWSYLFLYFFPLLCYCRYKNRLTKFYYLLPGVVHRPQRISVQQILSSEKKLAKNVAVTVPFSGVTSIVLLRVVVGGRGGGGDRFDSFSFWLQATSAPIAMPWPPRACLGLTGPVWAYPGLSGPTWACLGLPGLPGPARACLCLPKPAWAYLGMGLPGMPGPTRVCLGLTRTCLGLPGPT